MHTVFYTNFRDLYRRNLHVMEKELNEVNPDVNLIIRCTAIRVAYRELYSKMCYANPPEFREGNLPTLLTDGDWYRWEQNL